MGFDKRDGAKVYQPQDGDTLAAIAERETAAGNPLSWQELARYNWGTTDPDEVNEHLRDELGAHWRDEDKNFVISADAEGRGELRIPLRYAKPGLALDTTHTLRVKSRRAPPQFLACCRIPGITFAFDQSFLRPSVVDFLAPLERALAEHPEHKLLVYGHTDPAGKESYNKGLSERRARSAYAFITNDADAWEDLYQQEDWGLCVVQTILKDLGGEFDPGPIDGEYGPLTRTALENYQNARGLNPNGKYDAATRKQLFLDYMTGKHDVELTPEQFMEPKHMGCGEYNLLTPEAEIETEAAALEARFGDGDLRVVQEILAELGPPYHPGPIDGTDNPQTRAALERYQRRCGLSASGTANSATRQRLFWEKANEYNRRATFFLFHPARLPHLPCERGATGPCQQQRSRLTPRYTEGFSCSFYDSIARRCDCEGGLLPGTPTPALRVFLQLKFLGPDGVKRPFPEQVPVSVVPEVGDPFELQTAAEGRLTFDLERSSRAFGLRFASAGVPYIASAPDDAEQRWVPEAEVDALIDTGWRAFKLPFSKLPGSDWGTTDSDWAAIDEPSYVDGRFTDLENMDVDIGSGGAPAELTLDPHWQYLKFIYFDRWLKKTLSILPVTLEGFAEQAGSTPTTRSNWTIETPHACQCLPWILREPAKPDENILLQFQTAPDTFIESHHDGSRTLSVGPQNTPGPDRLRFYDLPEIWKSQRYHVRVLQGAGGKQVAKRGEFEQFADQGMSKSQPLLFSLDDMVLVLKSAPGSSMVTIQPWRPADRATLFSHRFAGGSKLSSVGLYDPDPERPHWSRLSTVETERNYIAEYPDWTRLVIADGRLYDVFDQRTPDEAGAVVGARAATHWLVIPGDFFRRERDFSQQHDRRGDGKTTRIGRLEVALLRCCDTLDGKEIAVTFQHMRLRLDFSDKKLPKAVRKDLAKQAEWAHTAVTGIARRWNAPDAAYHPKAPLLVPEDPQHILQEDPARALQVRVLAFLMPVWDKAADVNFDITVVKKGRAHMDSEGGTGVLAYDDHLPGKSLHKGEFVAAHEFGHALSLNDEYIETSNSASYDAPGFFSWTPGSAYSPDHKGMMRGNRDIRARYFWHLAEWLRSMDSDRPYYVVHGPHKYRLPRHPNQPRRTFVSWPFNQQTQFRRGERGFADLFLNVYGNDQFSENGLLPGHRLDGILTVVVKFKLTFNNTNNYDMILNAARRMNNTLQRALNYRSPDQIGRWYLDGEHDGRPFHKCLLYFSPRFLVTDFPGGPLMATDYAKKLGVLVKKASGLIDYQATKKRYAERIQEIEALQPAHFSVIVAATGFAGGPKYKWTGQNTLWLKSGLKVGKRLTERFPEMLGIAGKTCAQLTDEDLRPLAEQVMSKVNGIHRF